MAVTLPQRLVGRDAIGVDEARAPKGTVVNKCVEAITTISLTVATGCAWPYQERGNPSQSFVGMPEAGIASSRKVAKWQETSV